MGYHYVNPTYISDMNIDPTLPEILLYVTDDEGERKLAGVEFFKADADQDPETDADRRPCSGTDSKARCQATNPACPFISTCMPGSSSATRPVNWRPGTHV